MSATRSLELTAESLRGLERTVKVVRDFRRDGMSRALIEQSLNYDATLNHLKEYAAQAIAIVFDGAPMPQVQAETEMNSAMPVAESLPVETAPAAATAGAVPVWEKPSHQDIPLHELDLEELGLDIFNEQDDNFINAIFEAKHKKEVELLEPQPDQVEIARTFQLLKQPNDVVEIRCPNTDKGTAAGLYSDVNELLKDSHELSARNGVKNVYWTLQALMPLECANGFRFYVKKGEAVNDKQVATYRWLPLDFDPTRKHSTQDVCSTNGEKALAYDLALKVRAFLDGFGIQTILADSGNGYHLLARIDLPVNAENTRLIASLLNGFSGKFKTSDVDIDTAVFNSSRIWKLYGTVARKGENTPERPYRVARVLDAPTLQVVLEAQLREVLSSLAGSTSASSTTTFPEKTVYPRNADGKLERNRHNATVQRLGEIHANNEYLNYESRLEALLKWREENLVNPDNEHNAKKLQAMVKDSLESWKPSGKLTLNLTASAQQPAVSAPSAAPVVLIAPPTFHNVSYPKFPSWVMKGTSIYEGFVKPYCDKNSRIDYFMWAPTAAMFMNYLGTKVRVAMRGWKPSFYLVFIGEKDRAHKSSSIKDGMKYLESAGLLSMYSRETKNAEGKSIVWEAGSPEGLGTDMQRTNCKNAVLFYDELSTLVSKSQIEGSGMMGALLKMYESNNFSNSVKKKADAFSVGPDSYVASVITATTDQRFDELWGQFAGDDTGLNSRFTFILQPQQLPEEELEEVVPFFEATEKTKARANAAINQGLFEFDYGFDGEELLKDCQKMCRGRAEIRAEKWALYFAIDLGKTVIDSECIDRGVALVNYEHAVKKYLATEEAATKAAGLQQTMVRLLERSKGRIPEHGRQGFRALTGERKYGTDMWRKAFYGLVNEGVLRQDNGDIVMMRSWGGNHD